MEQLKTNRMENYIGKKVKIIGSHPHSGVIGRGVSFDKIDGCAEPGLLVENNNGLRFRVFHSSEVEYSE